MKTMMVNKKNGLMYNMKSFHTFMRDRCGYNPETDKFEKWSIVGYRGGHSWKTQTTVTFPFDTEEERDTVWEELGKI